MTGKDYLPPADGEFVGGNDQKAQVTSEPCSENRWEREGDTSICMHV